MFPLPPRCSHPPLSAPMFTLSCVWFTVTADEHTSHVITVQSPLLPLRFIPAWYTPRVWTGVQWRHYSITQNHFVALKIFCFLPIDFILFFFGRTAWLLGLSCPSGKKPAPSAVEGQSLNLWVAREVLISIFPWLQGCLLSSMIHGVAKSRTRLSEWTELNDT